MVHPAVNVTLDPAVQRAYVTISDTDNYPLLNDVMETLRECQVSYWIDEKAIEKVLRQRLIGEPIIAATAKDGKAEITIERNGREAYVTMHPAYGGKTVTADDIKEMLAEHEVVFGVDCAAIEKAVLEGIYNRRILIAAGREPVEGKDAVIEYMFTADTTIHPKEIGSDKVDFRELRTISSVKKDIVLARKTPAVPGQNGTTVSGKPIVVKTVKDIKLRAGKNTRLSEDGLQVLSNADGQPVVNEKTITVEPILEIHGDIDFSVGNIDFAGSVKVFGSINSGFSVKATENVEVDGVAEDSYVEAGGDVLLKGGVQGRNKGIIKAGGNVRALFIQYGTIESDKDILVGEVLHSNLSAGGKIFVVTGKGRICGGNVSAHTLIEAKVVGSESGARTELRVGFNPKEKKKLQEKQREKAETEERLSQVMKALHILGEQRLGANFTAEKETMYHRLIATSEEFTQVIDLLAEEINVLEETIERAQEPRIKVRHILYPNVHVTVKNLSFETKNEFQCTMLYEEEGQIQIAEYVV